MQGHTILCGYCAICWPVLAWRRLRLRSHGVRDSLLVFERNGLPQPISNTSVIKCTSVVLSLEQHMAVFLATYRVYTFKIGFLKKVHGVQTPTTLPPCSLWVFPGDLSGSLGKKNLSFPSHHQLHLVHLRKTADWWSNVASRGASHRPCVARHKQSNPCLARGQQTTSLHLTNNEQGTRSWDTQRRHPLTIRNTQTTPTPLGCLLYTKCYPRKTS